jgi:hypothetical protein
MKYEIVKFTSDNINYTSSFYGIRRRNFLEVLFNFGGDFFDFNSRDYKNWFWKSSSVYFKDCKTKDINLLYYNHSRFTNNVIDEIIK